MAKDAVNTGTTNSKGKLHRLTKGGNFSSQCQFNVTPMIDVVFLLIIFFMLICKYIGQENYRIDLPDNCRQAIVPARAERDAVTVSVIPYETRDYGGPGAGKAGRVIYAVKAREFVPFKGKYVYNKDLLVEDISRAIKQVVAKQRKLKGDDYKPLIYLRADKALGYGKVQYMLLALSRAGVRDVHLAAYRDKHVKKY